MGLAPKLAAVVSDKMRHLDLATLQLQRVNHPPNLRRDQNYPLWPQQATADADELMRRNDIRVANRR
jgi:hypothetical protein